MNITTRFLSEIASAAAGRPVSVKLFGGIHEGQRLDGRATADTIELSRHLFQPSGGDPLETWLHEAGHVLLHAQRSPSAEAEKEAETFAQTVLSRTGRGWWRYALTGALLRQERSKVIATLREVAGEMSTPTPTPTPTRQTQNTSARHTDTRQTDTSAMENQIRSEIRLCEELQKRGGSTRLQRLIINSAEGKLDALEAMDNPSKRGTLRRSTFETRPLASVYETR